MAKKTAPLLRLGASSGMRQPTLITALGVSKNGKFAVTGDEQGVARVFDVSIGACVAQVELPKKRLRPGQRELLAASISDDGKLICLQVRQDSQCFIGDVTNWDPFVVLPGFGPRARISPVGGPAAIIQGWLHLHEEQEELFSHWEPQSHATDLDFAADGRVVVAFDRRKKNDHTKADGAVLRVFSKVGKTLRQIEVDDDFHGARVGFLDDDTVLAVSPHRVHSWSLKSNRVTARPLETKDLVAVLAPLELIVTERGLVSVKSGKLALGTKNPDWAVSSDGQVLLAAEGSSLNRYDPKTLETMAGASMNTPVHGVAFTGNTLWAADEASLLEFSLLDGGTKRTVPLPEKTRPMTMATDASSVLCQTPKGSIVLELPSGEPRGPIIERSHRIPALSRSGDQLSLTGPTGLSVSVYDVKTGRQRHLFDPSAVELTYGRAFSGDGTLLASARWPGVMAVWDLKRGKCVTTFRAPVNGRPAWGLALTKQHLVMGADGTAKVWVMSLPRGELVRTLSGMKGKGVWEVVLSPNEAFVAARTPSSVGVWSLETGKKLHVFPLVAWSLAFSADSKRLAMGLSGEIVIAEVWSVPRRSVPHQRAGHTVPPA